MPADPVTPTPESTDRLPGHGSIALDEPALVQPDEASVHDQ